ncbi:tRNA (guanosine(37)-N1)-methyltransferase TrmD [Schaalia suimastitidis]|uniref:tRNA (guanosine(37)-N1)-methyltransferase TrmD n=1 Tax=Schaalia suimastitidis TaxID=121163 RepID=UPI0003F5709E|nr:tRNA (guanosine(37)-N1)-methyltransferase TrmD [Schaalia suimastitidis]
MRLDLISIFPDYFAPLDLSLMGKARQAGLLTVAVHDLRRWATDKHRTVDDTPYGGGAGMVMRPDVWGKAIDEALAQPVLPQKGASPRRILAIPTPSGTPFTQSVAEELTSADHIIVACGRYEGIDQRVGDYYEAEGIEVLYFSIGDYVLNGGEVAALVLAEAVGRLLDGVVGNPESLVEESHSDDGLLEYPAYTRPASWRDFDVPEVLRGGDHAAIGRWRRERSLERTAVRRPDMVARLDPATLGTTDREILARKGYVLVPRSARLVIRPATADDAAAISALASRTFPDACPEHLPRQAIDDFIATQLGVDVFRELLANPDRNRILIATIDGDDTHPVGYTLTHVGPHALPDGMVRPGKIDTTAAYLSKCYLDAAWRGSGIAGALLEVAVDDVYTHTQHTQVVLGTNIGNKRSTAFYKRHGFRIAGRRHFDVGGVDNIDNVLVRNITR